jgi:myo-inositol-1(or 4)-monophosphatase
MPGPGREREELLELARTVALEAAELVRRGGAGTVAVAATKSSPVDVVTEVDRASERLIYDRILAARPGDGFLGEEGAAAGSVDGGDVSPADSGSGVTWVVDPIDGTVNFLYGIPQYAVSIAARAGAEVVAGVVINVASGECFSATLGGGAFLDGAPIRVRATPPVTERLVGTGFSYDATVRVEQAAAVAALLPQVRDVRRMGAAALDLCAVGAGRLDGYVEEGLNPWDVAAGGLVAAEAGARVERGVGVGGMTCVICAPEDGFAQFRDLVHRCGFLRE